MIDKYNTMEYIKDFDGWNLKKQEINNKAYNYKLFFEQREVWWVSVGVNVGVEADGKHKNFERPMLIISVFNGHMLWVIPLTSRKKDGEHYIKIAHEKGVSWANVPQMRVISSKRLLRKIGMISEGDFESITNKISQYIQINPRKGGGLGGRSH